MPELPAETGSLLTQRAGPLPMWGWGIVILGGAYGVKMWNDRKAGKAQAESASTSAGYNSASLPSNIQPYFTQVNEGGSQSYVNSPITAIGRQQVEAGGTVNQNQTVSYPGVNGSSVTVTAPAPVTAPSGPAPVPAPPAPKGQWLTTVKWNPADRNAPSTLSGLALKAYGNASAWQRIWNAPQNADLVRRRGSPSKIQPGDRFWAPA
jgi:nucleoid-associated protein YgaU